MFSYIGIWALMRTSHFSPANFYGKPLSKYLHTASTEACWKILEYVGLWANTVRAALPFSRVPGNSFCFTTIFQKSNNYRTKPFLTWHFINFWQHYTEIELGVGGFENQRAWSVHTEHFANRTDNSDMYFHFRAKVRLTRKHPSFMASL